MRKIFTLIAAVLFTASVFAQSPQKMSYQAVIRNSSNALVTNTQIGMEINIRQGSPTGTVVYTETQTPTTNANGLVSIEIGGGAGFSTINWANGPYFIETKTAIVPPLTTYTITGTSQLLTVPYALHAKTAETVTGTITETDPVFTGSQAANITATDITNLSNLSGVNTGDQDLSGLATKTQLGDSIALVRSEIQIPDVSGFLTSETDPIWKASPSFGITNTNVSNWNTAFGWGNHAGLYRPIAWAPSWSDVTDKPTLRYLGEEYLGGIIFYLYIGSDGKQHGLVVSKTESTATWSGSALVGADRTEDGAYNMNLMPTGAGTARTWVEETLGAGWYLPSIDELSILWHNRYHVNKTARAIDSTLLSTTTLYWSSTECNAAGACNFSFSLGFTSSSIKTNTCSVRAVRAF